MRKSLLSLAILALIAAPTFAADKVTIGDKAPSFDGLPAVVNGARSTLTLSDIKEDVVVVVFLANHCPMVGVQRGPDHRPGQQLQGQERQGRRHLLHRRPRLQGEGRHPRPSRPASRRRATTTSTPTTRAASVGKAYGATVTPEFFVLDKDRKVRYTRRPRQQPADETKAKKNYVKDAVDALLAGKDVEKSETQARGCGIAYGKSSSSTGSRVAGPGQPIPPDARRRPIPRRRASFPETPIGPATGRMTM